MADNREIINCPACGKEMVKIFMPSQGVNLDVCINGCGGIYFDNREYKMFDEPHEDITPLLDVLKGKEFEPVDKFAVRKCPICRSDMVKNFASAKHEIEIDECYSCGAKFLDCGELEKIRSQYNTETERTNDVLKQFYKDVGIMQNNEDFKGYSPVNFDCSKSEKHRQILTGIICGVFVTLFILVALTYFFKDEFIKIISLI